MSSEKSFNPDSVNFDFKMPELPIEQGDTPQTQSWAAGRMAIYAALDAALTTHIVQAVKSLNELKWLVEEDVRRTLTELGEQRGTLRHEVDDLRSLQERLENELKISQRELDGVRAQKIGTEREAQNLLQDAQQERERLLREITELRAKSENLPTTLKPKDKEQIWEKFVGTPTPLFPQDENFPTAPKALSANNAPLVAFRPPLEPEVKPAAPRSSNDSLISFPSEKAKGKEPEQEAGKKGEASKLVASTPRFEEKPRFQLPVDVFEFNDEEAEFDDVPTRRVPGGSAIIRLDKIDLSVPEKKGGEKPEAAASAPQNTSSSEVAQGNVSEAVQRARDARIEATRQRVQQLLNRREGAGANLPEAEEVPANLADFGDRPTFASVGAGNQPKNLEKAEMQEIGAKLGLDDVVTPPPMSAVRFNPGFKPRSATGPLAPVAPKPRQPEPEPVVAMDAAGSFTPPTNRGESDLTTPAPRIGDLGEDMAHQFPRQSNTNFVPPRSAPQLTEMQRESLAKFASIPLPLPPAGSNLERTGVGEVETRLTISNLQGLSLLMMEKVMRGLPGVHHVTVTDFRRGVLEMDVRHSPDVKLDEVLPAMPDLKLMLVERGVNSLEFLQER